MKTNYRFWIIVVISSLIGILIAWIDSRPNWDDSGISAGLIFCSSAFFGFIMKKQPWLWAITIGIWIPLYNIYLNKNYSILLVLIIAFIGSYLGSLFHKLFLKEG